MENLRYIATDDAKVDKECQLFSYWSVFASVIAILLALIYLFPGKELVSVLLNQKYFAEVDLSYSLLLRKDNDGINLREITNKPSDVIKKLDNSLRSPNQTVENLWLSYIILRVIAYNIQHSPAVRKEAQIGMLHYYDVFKGLPITDKEGERLAQDALGIQEAKYALSFYELLLARNAHRSSEFYLTVIQVALQAGRPDVAEKYLITYLEINNKGNSLST